MTGLRFSAAFLLICLASAAPAAQGEDGAKVATPTAEQVPGFVHAGKELLLKGFPAEAIRHYLDPVIKSYTESHSNPNVQVYAAHSMAESIVYVGLAAAADDKKGVAKNKSIVLDGAWTDALELKAYALTELGRIDEAKSVLQRAIALSPEYPPPWIELGSDYQSEKNWDAALDAYQHSEDATNFVDDGKAKSENLARALRGKAFVLTELGRLEESEALYKRCLSINPDDAGAKHELEYIAYLRGKQKQNDPGSSR